MHGLPDDEMNSFDAALFLNLSRMLELQCAFVLMQVMASYEEMSQKKRCCVSIFSQERHSPAL